LQARARWLAFIALAVVPMACAGSDLGLAREVARRLDHVLDADDPNRETHLSWLRKMGDEVYRDPLLARLEGAPPDVVARAATLLDLHRDEPDRALLIEAAWTSLSGSPSHEDVRIANALLYRLEPPLPEALLLRAAEVAALAIRAPEPADSHATDPPISTEADTPEAHPAYRPNAIRLAQRVVTLAERAGKPAAITPIFAAMEALPPGVDGPTDAPEDGLGQLGREVSPLLWALDQDDPLCAPPSGGTDVDAHAILRLLLARLVIFSGESAPTLVVVDGIECLESRSLAGQRVRILPSAAVPRHSAGMGAGPRLDIRLEPADHILEERPWDTWAPLALTDSPPDALYRVSLRHGGPRKGLPPAVHTKLLGRVDGTWHILSRGYVSGCATSPGL
jgi:hypothetical protein